jgi:hypothetical protein
MEFIALLISRIAKRSLTLNQHMAGKHDRQFGWQRG